MSSSLCRDIAVADLLIDNARIVTPAGVIEHGSLLVEDGHIARLRAGAQRARAPRLDAAGDLLLPGIVDIHSDVIEKAVQPRPGGDFPVDIALHELDKQIVACGITTIYHCLCFTEIDDSGLRGPQTVAHLVEAINRLAPQLMARTRIHARYEIVGGHPLEPLEEYMQNGRIHLFSLMDHTPGQGQFTDFEHFKAYYGRSRGYTAEEIRQLADRRLKDRASLDENKLRRLCDVAQRYGLRIASHDDDTAAKVKWVKSLGATISEFPVRTAAARAAKAAGMYVGVGAPNLLRGRSLTNNLSARDAILGGYADLLCSDYAPMAMLHSALRLHAEGAITLPQAVDLIAGAPARAVGIEKEVGAIAEGLAADLVLVNTDGPVRRVRRTFVRGRTVYAGP